MLNSKPQSGIVISTKLNHSFLEGMLAEAKEVFKAWEARYGDHKAHPSSYKDNKQLMERALSQLELIASLCRELQECSFHDLAQLAF